MYGFIIFAAMHLDRYPVTIGETSMVYEFVSEGFNGKIAKLVIYSETNVYGLYNLGFGDKNNITGIIDDEVITNNGDSKKVLATVVSTLYSFIENFPNAQIMAIGNNKARNRLYRIGITNNLDSIKEDFEIFGYKNQWLPFDKNIDFDAFLVIRKKK